MSQPTVDRVESFLIDLPTIRPHQLSMAVMQRQTMVVVRLTCSDGVDGLGEATTIGGLAYGEESPEGIKLTLDRYLVPAVLGRDATSVNGAMAALHQVARGNRFAKSALEMALLDAQGKRLGVPVSTLLGGAVVDSLPVLWTLASGDTARDIAEAEELLAAGRHRMFKLKVGRREPAQDVAHVAAIKRALGDRARITVDANQAWSESVAKRAIHALQEAGVDLIEQPIARENHAGMARLVQRFVVPIMADEAVTGPEDAYALAKAGCADVFALKIAKAGGMFGVLKTAAVAEGAGVSVYGGTMLEGSIGTIAAAHVFSTMGSLPWGTELFGPLLLTDDIVTPRPTYLDGRLRVPTGPGLGLSLVPEKVAQYRRSDDTPGG